MVIDLAVFPDAGPLSSVPPESTVTLRTDKLETTEILKPLQITTESAAPGTTAEAAPPQADADHVEANAKSPEALE